MFFINLGVILLLVIWLMIMVLIKNFIVIIQFFNNKIKVLIRVIIVLVKGIKLVNFKLKVKRML